MIPGRSELQQRALRALERGQPLEALRHAWTLADRSHPAGEELDRPLRLMLRCFREAGRDRAAAAIHLHFNEHADASRLVPQERTDQARCAEQAGDPERAARWYEQAGWLGHAAIQLERGGDQQGARVLWERLTGDPRCEANSYVAGLVRFNLARACAAVGDERAARKALVECVHLLEAAADGFEARGLRERAFDCFQVILTIGHEGAFENLAEGYLNCIRILSEDNLRYYVLQYYEDFQKAALERGELRAAATLFAEAADYARRHRMPYEDHYRIRAAECYVATAEHAVREGDPMEIVENAYGAAVTTYSELGLYGRARALYALLAELPLERERRARYARLEQRIAELEDREVRAVPFPEHLRMDTAYPEIWRLDVVEWEQAGDAAETMGEVAGDERWPAYSRRLALLCRLHQLGSGEDPPSVDTLVGLASRLGRTGIYPALAPLEHMYEHEDARVRTACMRAVRELFFKRSFELVMRGLDDADPSVRREATAAVRSLSFVHAFDPLARIYRFSPQPEARRAALESIARIETGEARDLLDEVARYGDPDDRAVIERVRDRRRRAVTGR